MISRTTTFANKLCSSFFSLKVGGGKQKIGGLVTLKLDKGGRKESDQK